MTNDFKDRIKKAMEGYDKRQNPVPTGRKNKKPEAVIEAEIYKHLNSIGWSIDFYESSTFGINPEYQDYKVRPGHSDLAGCMPNGTAAYIEVKNKGKRSTLSSTQREFLVEKINSNAFAVCADSLDYVLKSFEAWLSAPSRKAFLLKELPRDKDSSSDASLFNE